MLQKVTLVKEIRMERVGVYIDGFNMYHAISDLGKTHLKWINLRKLSQLLIKTRSQKVVHIKYFSAYAKHLSGTPKVGSLLRHRKYVAALEAKRIQCIMGNFAKRDRYFSGPGYRARWRRYEEKQTDVGIGIHLINDAHLDLIDHAYVVSLDTDMLRAFILFRSQFPTKRITCVAPPARTHHREIQRVVSIRTIKVSQVEKSLFGAQIICGGRVAAKRPREYRP